MNHLRDRWDRDFTSDETVTEKDKVIAFEGIKENPVTNMLKDVSENYDGDEKCILIKTELRWLARKDFY